MSGRYLGWEIWGWDREGAGRRNFKSSFRKTDDILSFFPASGYYDFKSRRKSGNCICYLYPTFICLHKKGKQRKRIFHINILKMRLFFKRPMMFDFSLNELITTVMRKKEDNDFS